MVSITALIRRIYNLSTVHFDADPDFSADFELMSGCFFDTTSTPQHSAS
jgi:hypothetical protein